MLLWKLCLLSGTEVAESTPVDTHPFPHQWPLGPDNSAVGKVLILCLVMPARSLFLRLSV